MSKETTKPETVPLWLVQLATEGLEGLKESEEDYELWREWVEMGERQDELEEEAEEAIADARIRSAERYLEK